jgi:hypothetical protein
MSHIVTIQTEVRDAVAIQAACRRLNLAAPRHEKTSLFSGEVVGWAVRLIDRMWKALRSNLAERSAVHPQTTDVDCRIAMWRVEVIEKPVARDLSTSVLHLGRARKCRHRL